MYHQYKRTGLRRRRIWSRIPAIRVATKAFSIPFIEEDGLEADDIIACYVTAAKAAAGG